MRWQFGSVLFWPGGVWVSFVVILCVLILVCSQWEVSSDGFDGVDQADSSLLASGRISAFGYLLVMCLLVTVLSGAKYLYFDI